MKTLTSEYVQGVLENVFRQGAIKLKNYDQLAGDRESKKRIQEKEPEAEDKAGESSEIGARKILSIRTGKKPKVEEAEKEKAEKEKAGKEKVTTDKSGKAGEAKLLQSRQATERAFRFYGSIRPSSPQTLRIDPPTSPCLVQADQGSDFNIVSEHFIRQSGTPICPLSSIGYTGQSLKVRMADGRLIVFTHAANFEIGFAGVWRRIDCLVLPDGTWSRADHQLLLGIPWLYDVKAVLNIRDFTLELGDPSNGEEIQLIRGPKQNYDGKNSLRMYPVDEISRLCAEGLDSTGQSFATQATNGVVNGLVNGNPPINQPVEPALEEVYHDLTISRLQLGDLPAWTYFKDYAAPTVNTPPLTAASSSGAHGWVDFSQFLTLLKRDNALPPVDGRPKLSNNYFQMLDTWLPSSGLYSGGADALLGLLLSAFFDNDTCSQLMGKSQDS